MDEEKLKEIVRQEIQLAIDKTDTKNQFALSKTSFHTHNGLDSEKLPFIGLIDTPSSYSGEGGSLVVVNSSENALEFTDSPTISSNLSVLGNLVINGTIFTNGVGTVGRLKVASSQTLKGIYCGDVTSAGAAGTVFPTGWTVSNTGTGNYLITHNLGVVNYIILLTGSTARECNYTTVQANDVVILTRNSAGTLADGSFSFILIAL